MKLSIEQVREWYQQGGDPVHDFDHVLRVFHLGQRLAVSEGADLDIVETAALLHDVRGGLPGTKERAEHHLLSADYAGEVLSGKNWSKERIEAVQHAIRAHRFRNKNGEVPRTLEAKIIFDADKLDVLGAIGIARTIGFATQAGQPIFSNPSKLFLASGQKEPGEPHSAYHEFLYKLIKIKDLLFTESAKAIAIDRHQYMVEFFEQLSLEMVAKK
jgi:uncharacterized protein